MALLAAHNFENNQVGQFGARGQYSIDATSKIAGTYSIRVNMNGASAVNSNVYSAISPIGAYYQYSKFLFAPAGLFRYIFGSTSGVSDDHVLDVYLDTDNKMKASCYTGAGKTGGFSGAGTVALSASTKYRVQIYYSYNGGPNSRAYFYIKIHNDAGTLIDSFSAEHASLTGQSADDISWGNPDKAWYDTVTDDCYYDDIWLNDTSGSTNTGWPGLLDMTMVKPDSAGTYNTYTGVGDTTDKYKNWDEAARDDADYNRVPDNTYAAPYKQTSGIETLATGKTIRAIVHYGYFSTNTTTTRGKVREGSTDYDTGVATGSLVATVYGTLPSGGALTNAAVSALEIGAQWTGETGTGNNYNPTSDSAKTNWAGFGDTTNLYNNVDETSSDSDTTYNYTTTANAKISHGIAAPTWGDNVMYGVSVVFTARVTSGTGYARGFVTIGGTDYEDDVQFSLNTTYADKQALWLTSPATGVGWTRAEVEAAKFGVKNESSAGTELRVTIQKCQLALQGGHKVFQTFILAVNDETTEAGGGAVGDTRWPKMQPGGFLSPF